MATFSFPAAAFVVEGDPEAVRDSGRAYGRFATVAGQAVADLRSLDSGSSRARTRSATSRTVTSTPKRAKA